MHKNLITVGEEVSFKKFRSVMLFKLLGCGRMVRAMGGICGGINRRRRGRRGVVNGRYYLEGRRGKKEGTRWRRVKRVKKKKKKKTGGQEQNSKKKYKKRT